MTHHPPVRRAMILAAGKGTRLLPLTASKPKPMLEIAGTPLIGHQVAALRRAGIEEIVVNLHHLGKQIEDYLGDGSRFGVKVIFSWEAQLLETGGSIIKALPFFAEQPFWLLNGDIFTDFDFRTLPTAPQGANQAHIVLTPTPDHRRHGDFEFANGQVTGRGEDYVYCGIAALSPNMFAAKRPANLPTQPGQIFSLRDSYFTLLEQGRLGGQVFTGRWHDIGSVEQYQQAQDQAPAPG